MLIGAIKNGDPGDINQLAIWGERIEQWTLKAMEDLSLPSASPLWNS
jgi:hypothetical protein